ncbi:MAG: cation-translocating P-type ATPase [Candidatus Lokiarchaeia archaeon]
MSEWISKDVETTEKVLKTNINRGLSSKESQNRLKKYGPNILVKERRIRFLDIFKEEITEPLILLLIGVGVLYSIWGELRDAITILTIISALVFVEVWNEYRAKRSINALKRLASPTVLILRDGKLSEIRTTDIVPGDVIPLVAGQRITADLRLVETYGVSADESSLTGESVPVYKDANQVLAEDTELAERSNMVYAGTIITSGEGKGVVVATSVDTEIGRIAGLLEEVKEPKTPLQLSMKSLAKWLLWVALFFSALIPFLSFLRGIPFPQLLTNLLLLGSFLQIFLGISGPFPQLLTNLLLLGVFYEPLSFVSLSTIEVGINSFFGLLIWEQVEQLILTGLSLAFVTVPEELPIIITMVLGLGAYALSRKNSIVKRLRAAETLGSVTVICTDKTGTITQNKMSLKSIYSDGELTDSITLRIHDQILEAGLLSFETLSATKSKKAEYQNPIGVAILEAAKKNKISPDKLQKKYQIKEKFVFDRDRKIESFIYQNKKNNELYVFSSGAPESIIERSSRKLENGNVTDFITAEKMKLKDVISEMASNGERLIAFAYRKISSQEELKMERIERDLIFIGIMGFIDPPRLEVKDAIQSCERAGIRVIMITGDHPKTAKAIASSVGIDTDSEVLTGSEISSLSDRELEKAVKSISVFARATPEHKLRIVRLLRKQGEIVAVTGDGINDAPALKEAEIGIAMGVRGTDVAKETADMVLTDDNFATVETAVSEGRKMYDNLRKGVRYYLGVKIALVAIFILPILLGVPLPFAPIQIIVLELFMDLAASATFVAEPAEFDVMTRPPRDPKERFLTKSLQINIFLNAISLFAGVSICYLFVYYQTLNITTAQTAAFAAWLIGHIFLAFNSRSERESLYSLGFLSNKVMVAWALLAVGALIIATLVPALQEVLSLTYIDLSVWILVLIVTFVCTFWLEVKKLVQFRLAETRGRVDKTKR